MASNNEMIGIALDVQPDVVRGHHGQRHSELEREREVPTRRFEFRGQGVVGATVLLVDVYEYP